jgi:hypothetical protein
MSPNYRYYAAKMAERRARRLNPELERNLSELFSVVRHCEAIWALEERIERSR